MRPASAAHGRIDERSYYLTKIPPDFAAEEGMAVDQGDRLLSCGSPSTPTARETDEMRYYILSRYLSGKRFSEAVRGHWGIESMHWVLDVNFREDDSRTRERTLGNNLSWLRRFAVTPSQASSRQGQPPRQDDPLHDEHRLPHGSPDSSMRLICAGPALDPQGDIGKRHIEQQFHWLGHGDLYT